MAVVSIADKTICLACCAIVAFVAGWDAMWGDKYLKHWWAYRAHYFSLILCPAVFALANGAWCLVPRSERFLEV